MLRSNPPIATLAQIQKTGERFCSERSNFTAKAQRNLQSPDLTHLHSMLRLALLLRLNHSLPGIHFAA